MDGNDSWQDFNFLQRLVLKFSAHGLCWFLKGTVCTKYGVLGERTVIGIWVDVEAAACLSS